MSKPRDTSSKSKPVRLMYRAGLLLAILQLYFVLPAFAQGLPPADVPTFRREITETTVSNIIDPLTFTAQDNKVYRLAGLDFPDLYAAQTPDAASKAKEALSSLIKGKTLKLYTSKTAANRENRLGQTLVHAVEKSGNIWLQGWLLERGYARAFPTDMNPEAAGSMYLAENKAISANTGLWALPDNAVLSADNASKAIGKVGVISGTIRSATQMQTMLYLNFGTDWKSDFTIGLSANIRQKLAKQNIDVRQWAGRHVTVRGMVESYYGPYINLTTPAQLVLHPDGSKPATPAAAAPVNDSNNTGLHQYVVTQDKADNESKSEGADNAPQP